jgi:FkbM family methyltransferase
MPGIASIVLPDGRKVAHINRSETDYLYQEIFVDRVYTPGEFPNLPTAPTIFDVGANIGLFSLFAVERWPAARLFAFEPAPPVFEALQDNLGPHPNAIAVAAALGAENGTAALSYYPRYTMMSGLHAHPNADRGLAKQFLLNMTEGLPDPGERAAVVEAADDVLAGRFESVTVQCAVETAATAAARLGVERIDLLKVDVERAELDVLLGVGDDLWPRVGNVVVEVEDDDGRAEAIRALLSRHGLHIDVVHRDEYRGTALRMLYARR